MMPPPIPTHGPCTFIVRPHRAQTLLVLACPAFFLAPCGIVVWIMAKHDRCAMAEGHKDRSGEPLTKRSQTLAIIEPMAWAVKWLILCAIVVFTLLIDP